MPTIVYLSKIELTTLATLKTLGSGVPVVDASVYYYYKLNKKFGFVDSSGQPLSSNDSVTFFYYRKPKSDGTETISDSIEPIIDERWDDYLVFRACFDMTGNPQYLALAQAELERCRSLQLAEQDRMFVTPPSREYD